MSITLETKVGALAAEHPLATRVFARHGIDFCCGGGRPLGEVCEEKGLDAAAVLKEVHAELEQPGETMERWDQAPLGDVIDHILHAYHRPLREEMPRLETMARKVLDVHGEKDPDRFKRIVNVLVGLKAEVDSHMVKEEQILFPMIKAGSGAMAGGPIAVMEDEHLVVANALRELRELTDDYQAPEAACNTWRALWHGLDALEASFHQHIHLENNILFPRALAE
ncbi:MAG: iron-sulfur cluster repair di-iron protein [Candidatus Krumholzibacteria bacterium]|nr:iron-sulfur cluster repair di-iron protein [Candidatus Krumholzibacteria bacterium]MDH4338547.1 iron-sulfur cluster repair di-iron protein [Candidatus Krumholzibacteria bacterium]MDH5269250.1 iron-sulfur cluster repair di-iron protein [Candidatus Krumholzibacteria bacterium]